MLFAFTFDRFDGGKRDPAYVGSAITFHDDRTKWYDTI